MNKVLFNEFLINILLSLFAAINLGTGWGVFFFFSYLIATLFTFKESNGLQESNYPVIGLIKDVFFGGVSVFLAHGIEQILLLVPGIVNPSVTHDKQAAEECELFNMATESQAFSDCIESAERVATNKSSFVNSMSEYNTVFFDLSASELTIAVYLLARLIPLAFMFIRIGRQAFLVAFAHRAQS